MTKANRSPVIGTQSIRDGFDAGCIEQALNSRGAPGVTDLVLNPDAHRGYGAPVGCVLVSPTHIYPGPVGVDIKCSMSLLQLDLPEAAILDKPIPPRLDQCHRRTHAHGAGKGQRSVKKGRVVNADLGRRVVVESASEGVCRDLGIPPEWANYCEDAFSRRSHNQRDDLAARVDFLFAAGKTGGNSKTKCASSVPTAAAIISANAKPCTSRIATARAARLKCSACAMVASRFSRTAVPAASATTSQRTSSVCCKASSRVEHSAARPGQGTRVRAHSAPPKPTAYLDDWRSVRISRP